MTEKSPSSGIVIRDDDMEKVPHHHKEILKSLIADMNKTFHETLNQTKIHQVDPKGWTPEQIHTIIYIGLAFLVIIVTTLIAAAYMRSISEKRRSAAAIKSLLDMMAENRSVNSVYTMEGVYQHHQNQPNSGPDPSGTTIKLSDEEIPSILKNENGSQSVLESRIKLDPLDEQPKMPSPHLSAPILPPIAGRPRPVAQKVDRLPNSSSVAAISQNLTSMQLTTEDSVAYFPPEEDTNNLPEDKNSAPKA